ncbi:formylglycine-generating enzyme family protein [Lysobacter sp. GX 14042]|uniref:formylglycine-generating enzyme family protein n=1 Tax=Lysobacter sp. GX 14042 TaxID=2907155 RepID=UPI001F40E426|nr:formylglycine-generating enzyme family protein [Lysobacter sp. GX 14042]MCE7033095.1 formylglycine-generating enzyme family protein [Lysobacter sp. GX 14042]
MAVGVLAASAAPAAEAEYVRIPAGSFASALAYEDVPGEVEVAAFELMERPVTNAEFLAFVREHPQWRRDRVPQVMAEPRYLSHWPGPLDTGGAPADARPVVQVSWFAADAYCRAQDARLPGWNEWEYVAAADETRQDARADPVWRERILGWYSRPSDQPLVRAGAQVANVYGVRDMHGLVWEWTEDFSSLLVDADDRLQGDPDGARFCGAGALSMDDRENYAVLMRVAMLSSLQAGHTTGNLGFRCARSLP